ncbi:GNAT family N-acetyltransferase [Flexivirga sp. B27]
MNLSPSRDLDVALVRAATPELHAAAIQLVAELSTSAPSLRYDALESLVAHDAIDLFVASRDDDVIGMLTLATFPIPTGTRAWIEDVVVVSAARGSGAGMALVEAAIDRARELGARTVDLTSRPSRQAANRLYRRAGFEQRDTNVYRLQL